MAELSETKIKALIRLIEHERITVDDVKDSDYKAEVENKLQQ
ncbi:MAG: hypothetical protein ACQEQD_04460 [Bacillota bacterium]